MRCKLVSILSAAAAALAVAGGARAADPIDTIAATPQYSIFSTLLRAADLADTIRGLKACTVFVPPDTAFKRLPAGTVDNLRKPENRPQLLKLVKYHIVPARLTASFMEGPDTFMPTLGERQLAIDGDDPGEGIKIGNAQIVKRDIDGGNCIVHEINRILIP